MELHGIPFHGISWNSMEFYGSPMEFHGSSMELHGVPWKLHGIPWSSMEAPWNSMEFHGSSMEFHGVPWKPQGLSWSSMEAPWKPMESIEVSWNIGGVPWKLTEFHCVTHNSLKIKEWVIPTNNYSKWQQCIFHVRGHILTVQLPISDFWGQSNWQDRRPSDLFGSQRIFLNYCIN